MKVPPPPDITATTYIRKGLCQKQPKQPRWGGSYVASCPPSGGGRGAIQPDRRRGASLQLALLGGAALGGGQGLQFSYFQKPPVPGQELVPGCTSHAASRRGGGTSFT